MARHLVAQAESKRTYLGRYRFGYEVFDTDGTYSLVVHTSTYDGIRRDSHHATPETTLEALTKEAALQEAARKTSAHVRALMGA